MTSEDPTPHIEEFKRVTNELIDELKKTEELDIPEDTVIDKEIEEEINQLLNQLRDPNPETGVIYKQGQALMESNQTLMEIKKRISEDQTLIYGYTNKMMIESLKKTNEIISTDIKIIDSFMRILLKISKNKEIFKEHLEEEAKKAREPPPCCEYNSSQEERLKFDKLFKTFLERHIQYSYPHRPDHYENWWEKVETHIQEKMCEEHRQALFNNLNKRGLSTNKEGWRMRVHKKLSQESVQQLIKEIDENIKQLEPDQIQTEAAQDTTITT